ncbi:MAG: hypothetical protein ACK5U6_17370 [Pseudanabaena sp.]|jgi:hypothetical protein
MMQGIRDRWDALPVYAQYGIPAVGVAGLGLGAMALMGNPQQPAIQATQATGQANANEMAMVGDNVNLALRRQVYGDPLSDMEALQQAAKLSGNLYKFPEKKEKAIRDAEIEGQLMALQAEALRQQYLN